MQTDMSELITLRDKVYGMLKKYEPELKNTLRYRMFEYIVPREIEGITKYLALHDGNININETHLFEHKNNRGKLVKHEIILLNRNISSYHFSIRQNNTNLYEVRFEMYKDNDLRHIKYNDKTYRELPDNGNVYSHLITQYDDILGRINHDMQAGMLSMEEKLILEITHLFHDIPEKGTLEICNNQTKDQGKTKQERKQEDQIAQDIIKNEEILSNREKILLLGIYQQGEQKIGLFKFFERFRRIIGDTKLVFANAQYLGPNWDKVFGEMAIGYIHILGEGFQLPSGRIVKPIDLPSIKKTIIENKDRIDFQIDYTYKNCFHKMHPEKQDVADKNRELRNNIKENL